MIESALERGADCHLCGERLGLADEIDVDHVVPVAAGGTDDISNLRLAHASCNRSKGASAA
jgi:5-methylcytosine-specific restriction endonuclease McrA